MAPRRSAKYMGTTSSQRRMVAKAKSRRAGYQRTAIPAKFNRILRSTARKGEIKALDGVVGAGSLVNANINLTPNIQCLNLVAVGSSFFNRIGRKIEMKSLQLNMFFTLTGTVVANADYARVLVVYDRQTNGALAGATDILQCTDQLGANSSGPMSNINLNNRERFLILADERIWLPATNGSSGIVNGVGATDSAQRTGLNISRFIKLRGLVTHFKADSATAVIGDISTGALLIMTTGVYTAGTQGWLASFNSRLRFDDT